jgi:hypothetical protein
VFVPTLATAAAAFWWYAKAGQNRQLVILWVVANAVAAVPWLFWLPIVIHQALAPGSEVGLEHYVQPTLERAVFEAIRMLGVRYLPGGLPRELQMVTLIPLLAAAALALRQPERLLGIVLAIFAFGLPILALIAGYVVRPVYNDRMLIAIIPPFLVLASMFIARLSNAVLRWSVLMVVIGSQSVGLIFLYGLPQKEPWREIVALLHQQYDQGDAVLVYPEAAHSPFAYYAEREGIREHVFETGLNERSQNMALKLTPFDNVVRWLPLDQLYQKLKTYPHVWIVTRKIDVKDRNSQFRLALSDIGSMDLIAELEPAPLQLFRLDIATQ